MTTRAHRPLRSMGVLVISLSIWSAAMVRAAVPSLVYTGDAASVVVEMLDDGLVHFEFAPRGTASRRGRIPSTPMVVRRAYPGPSRLRRLGAYARETAALRVEIDANSCVHVTDLTRPSPVAVATLCAGQLSAERAVLSVATPGTQAMYGLGEHFLTAGQVNGDLRGHLIEPGSPTGNALTSFDGGVTGNAQFPVLYALDAAGAGYALFVDGPRAQTWDLGSDPFEVRTSGEVLRGYVIAGTDVAGLRRRYLDLVGRPLVPPKKAFGLWISQFGFDDWAELEDELRTLRANHIPVDGFMMDLQWFGGVFNRPSHIGALTWDTSKFPDPAAEIARLRDAGGVGLMTIEESYVDASRPELADLARRGYLPRACAGCGPVDLSSWWGHGSMLDWTNAAAGDYWHARKRQPLIDMGVLGHWLDLGEPEDFAAGAVYHGVPRLGLRTQPDVQNLYNLAWAASVARGYRRHRNRQRPFMLSRSGTAGMERFGAAMWSGDIGARMTSLAAHLNVQMHMSFSGMDWFGADVGGYHRGALDGDANVLYTRWLADAALLDVPLRPHTENLCNCKQTAPDRIGDLASNRANVRLRYQLIPYLYSLAHRAHRTGDAVVAPLPLHYPGDANVRGLADEKLLGRDLLVAPVTTYGRPARDVYLPAGTWTDFRTGACERSVGESRHDVAASVDGAFVVPLFARDGAIIPETYVDDATMNALGDRTDGIRHDELVVRVYAAGPRSAGRFTLYEDDGQTVAYLHGAVRKTRITARRAGDRVAVTIAAAVGGYDGAPARRDAVIELATCGAVPTAVALDGVALERRDKDRDGPGWSLADDGRIRIRTGRIDVTRPKYVVVTLAG